MDKKTTNEKKIQDKIKEKERQEQEKKVSYRKMLIIIL